MRLKMLLLGLSITLILSCQIGQNASEPAGQTRGFSVTSITDAIIPTLSQTPSSTPIPTSTPTLDPLTATALFEEQATQIAANAIATDQAKNTIATSTASANNALATVNAMNMTATARQETANLNATEIAQYTSIDPNELITHPNDHIGESVVVRGRVFYVINNTDFQIWLDGVSYEPVHIAMVNPYNDIFENNSVTVYGIVAGEACGTNISGGQVCQPQIVGVFYEKR